MPLEIAALWPPLGQQQVPGLCALWLVWGQKGWNKTTYLQCAWCRLVRYKSLEEEAKGKGSAVVRAALEKEDMRINAALYLLLRAADRFHATYNRFPGSFDK